METQLNINFSNRLYRLPPYLFGELNELKLSKRQKGIDIIDFGMGNPDKATPDHIVEKMREVILDSRNHRYSASRGIFNLRKAISFFYEKFWNVPLDPEKETIAVIGTKEGLSHLSLALLGPGDTALVPNPAFPIHMYSAILAGANVINIPLGEAEDFIRDLKNMTENLHPKPKVLFLNYPNNPTGKVVDLSFFEEVVQFAKFHNMVVIHDFAYGSLTFDGYKAPSFLQAKGAKDIGVEFYTMSKSYNMPGWRIGFCVGNPDLVGALAKIKGYYDYGIFQTIQIAAIVALRGSQDPVKENASLYQNRRDLLCEGLIKMGWPCEKPKASMFVWPKIPEPYQNMRSLEFSRFLMDKAEVAVSPGIGFGTNGDEYIRIALVENENRIRQALRNIKKALPLLKGD